MTAALTLGCQANQKFRLLTKSSLVHVPGWPRCRFLFGGFFFLGAGAVISLQDVQYLGSELGVVLGVNCFPGTGSVFGLRVRGAGQIGEERRMVAGRRTPCDGLSSCCWRHISLGKPSKLNGLENPNGQCQF